jgi:hypothetical protein
MATASEKYASEGRLSWTLAVISEYLIFELAAFLRLANQQSLEAVPVSVL